MLETVREERGLCHDRLVSCEWNVRPFNSERRVRRRILTTEAIVLLRRERHWIHVVAREVGLAAPILGLGWWTGNRSTSADQICSPSVPMCPLRRGDARSGIHTDLGFADNFCETFVKIIWEWIHSIRCVLKMIRLVMGDEQWIHRGNNVRNNLRYSIMDVLHRHLCRWCAIIWVRA